MITTLVIIMISIGVLVISTVAWLTAGWIARRLVDSGALKLPPTPGEAITRQLREQLPSKPTQTKAD